MFSVQVAADPDRHQNLHISNWSIFKDIKETVTERRRKINNTTHSEGH